MLVGQRHAYHFPYPRSGGRRHVRAQAPRCDVHDHPHVIAGVHGLDHPATQHTVGRQTDMLGPDGQRP
ncbi:MAG: hypothetical protein WKF40_01945 [Thermoleophilaceae bacterium]